MAEIKAEDSNFAIHIRSILKQDIHKTSLRENPNLIFNHMTERCIGSTLKAHNRINFHIDNRNSKIKNIDVKYNLIDYLKKDIKNINSKEITIGFYDSKQHHGIQLADVLSNTVWRKYERGIETDYQCLDKHDIISTQSVL